MATVASTPEQRRRQLIAAAAQANETRVSEILAEDSLWALPADRDALRVALQRVAARGHLGITQALLDQGAEVEPQREGETGALFKAAEAGHVAVVAELLEHGAWANTRAQARGDQTALFPACVRGHVRVVELLLKAGADANVRDKQERTPLLFWAAERQVQTPETDAWTEEMLELLVCVGGAHLEDHDAIYRTPLLWAVANGNVQMARSLLGDEDEDEKKHGRTSGPSYRRTANVEAVNNRGRTPLHLAAEDNRTELVRLLLRHGADPNASSDGGWTALHNAAQSGHAGPVDLLLKHGANVNARLSNGMTALHWAAFNNHEDVVQLLLARDDIRLDLQDSFDRTPMICAAERFNRIIVRMLSTRAVEQLSPAARIACDQFKATIVDFSTFRDGKQHQVFKRSVFDVLYGWDEKTQRAAVETQTKNIKYQPQFRWIHLPANNIDWVQTLLSKWFIEGGCHDVEPFKALQKCFDQEHRDPHARGHFMRTFCHRIPSNRSGVLPSPREKDRSAFPTLAEEPLLGAALTPSSLAANKSPQSQQSAGSPDKKKSKSDLLTERHGRRPKRAAGSPGNPPGTKAMRARAHSLTQFPLSRQPIKLSQNTSIFVMFMPFLHYETDERRKRMSNAINLVRQNKEPADRSLKDVMLIKAYLNSSRPLHPRRTLDQYFYHGIDTSIRDVDQVVYRYLKRHKLEKKVFMVDQLWLWVLGNDLVVTCFPERWDQPSRDPLNMVDGIIEEMNAKTRPPVQSVFDLAMLITHRCSGMFDRYRPTDQEYQFLDMFESSIGRMTNLESELFMMFNRASAMSARWLELNRQAQAQSQPRVAVPSGQAHGRSQSQAQFQPQPLSRRNTMQGLPVEMSTLEMLPEREEFSASLQDIATEYFPDALLDIDVETSLLAETKDIRDELNILFVVLDAQMGLLQELEGHMADDLRQAGQPGKPATGANLGLAGITGITATANTESILNELRKRSRDQKRLLEIHRKDIERMDRQAESIYLSLTHLLDLKQKHSNALDARFARESAMIAGRQGQTIMAFTIVTIVFLPMSFIAAFFSIGVEDWPTTLTLSYVSKYMFGIGLGISVPLIVMAFIVPDMSAAVHGAFWGMRNRISDWKNDRRTRLQQKKHQQSLENISTADSAGESIVLMDKTRSVSAAMRRDDSFENTARLPTSWRPNTQSTASTVAGLPGTYYQPHFSPNTPGVQGSPNKTPTGRQWTNNFDRIADLEKCTT